MNTQQLLQESERSRLALLSILEDQRIIQEELQKSEVRYRSIFENVRDAIYTISPEGKLLTINPAFETLTGWTVEEWIDKPFSDLVHPADLPKAIDVFQKVMSGEKIESYELRIKIKSGGYRIGEFTPSPLILNGKIVGALGIARDITERKRAEEALRESEERWQFAHEGPGDGVWDWNAQTNKVFFSHQWKAMLGYDDNEIGNELSEWEKRVHPEDLDYVHNEINKHFNGEIPIYQSEHRMMCKDGTYKWILDRGKVISRSEEGKPLRVIGTHTDITERKRAEEELFIAKMKIEESETKFKAITNQATEGIALSDLEGNYKFVNPAFCTMTGYSEEELLTMTVFDVKAKTQPHESFFQSKSTKEGLPIEVNLQRKDKSEFISEIIGRVIKVGNQDFVLGTVRDITERKRAEEEILQRAKQLATLLTASQALAATLDLTTILQTITESAAEIMQLGTTAIYLLEGGNLYLGATTPPLPLQFPETFRHSSLADHPHIHEAVTTGLPVIIPDAAIAQLTKAEHAISDVRGLRTILYIPLIVGEKTVGTLILGTVGVTRNFTESQIDLFRTLSNQAAIAIENARLLNEIRQRNKEMNILDSIIKSTTTRLELQSILDKALEGAIAITGLEGGTLCFVDNEKKVLDLSAAHNTSKEMFDELSAQSIAVGDCLCGKAAQTGEPLILWDNASGSEYATHESVRNEAIRFHAAFPLIAGGKTLGVLCVFARNEFKPTKQSLEMLNELCGTVALAIENAKLYQEVKKHTLQLEKIVSDRTAELQITNKELEAFSYSVAHDLRAPLRAIDGFSLALLEDYTDKLDKEGKNHLHRVRDGAKEMAQLIDDLLNLSRISRRELIRGTVDMSKIVKSIEEKLIASEAERKVKFSVADNIQVQGDNQLLKITMENLLNNAWKFTSKRKNTKIEFGVLEKEGKTVYYIKDNGVGFDMKYADKLFSPFQRLHRKEDYPGTGIGLATVRRIISKHGGSIWAESELDKGATFYFTL